MAWRTNDGRTSEDRPDRRGTEPGWGPRQRTGIRNHAADAAEHAATMFELQDERQRIREGGAAYVLFADNDD